MGSDPSPVYLREHGVAFQPGVRVWCSDRDKLVWEQEGTIIDVVGDGGYKVDFGESGVETLDWRQISPTQEEIDSDDARAWRAAQELRVFLCHGSEDKAEVRLLYDWLQRATELGWTSRTSHLALSGIRPSARRSTRAMLC